MLIFWGVDPNILISGVLSVLSSEIFLRNLRRTWLILSHPPEMKSNKLPSTPQKHRQTYNFYRKNFRHDLVKRWTRIFWPYKQTPYLRVLMWVNHIPPTWKTLWVFRYRLFLQRGKTGPDVPRTTWRHHASQFTKQHIIKDTTTHQSATWIVGQ